MKAAKAGLCKPKSGGTGKPKPMSRPRK